MQNPLRRSTCNRAESQDAEAWYNRGLILHKSDKDEEAVESFTAAIRIDPSHLEPFVQKGMLLHQLGQPEEAIECFNSAIEIAPDYAFPILRRGRYFAQSPGMMKHQLL
jgi:tetratricopeptide (TPR) repeat protein